MLAPIERAATRRASLARRAKLASRAQLARRTSLARRARRTSWARLARLARLASLARRASLASLAACIVLWPHPGAAPVAARTLPDTLAAGEVSAATAARMDGAPTSAAAVPAAVSTAGTGAGPGPMLDLATYPAQRWIVQLADAPLAAYTGGLPGLAPTALDVTGARRLDFAGPDVQAYRRHLTAAQRSLRQTLAKVAPGHRVDRSYTITVHGLAVKMTAQQAAATRALPGVRAVTPDIPMQPQMFSTPAQIGAPAVWAKLGGKGVAGAGVKVGIIDGGIYMFYDEAGKYAGNACFRDDGYTMPPGYPKGDERFTNKKVIAARAYFRPDDPPVAGSETPLPGLSSGDTAHGTHVAGTVACEADTPATYQGVDVTLDGVAPKAYLMNYKVFYAAKTRDGFQQGNAFVAELVKSIEDAIEDGADVISNSWGSSYQNTLAWPDPMVQAAELAMRSGVVAVFANGNSGGPSGTVISPGIAPSVISVGAVTKDTGVSMGDLSVTGPAPVPEELARMDVGAAAFGPQGLPEWSGSGIVAVETVTSNTQPTSCPLPGGASPYPADALAGKVALILSGGCQNSEKVYLAQAAGATAALVYNAGGDTLTLLSGTNRAAEVTIPSVFLRRSNGLALKAFAAEHPDTGISYQHRPHYAPMAGDVMAGFSSRGPTADKLLKPDVTAPGVSILSSGYGPAGDDPDGVYTGFGAISGTSMATPHVAGGAALLLAVHPEWRPWQVKAALMATANEDVFLNAEKTLRAGLLDQGAGRIDLAQAIEPGVLLDPPSLSGGEVRPGDVFSRTVRVLDAGTAGQWQLRLERQGGEDDARAVTIQPDVGTVTVPAAGAASFTLTVEVTAEARRGEYQTTLRLTQPESGKEVHLPFWLRVVQPPAVDVLLLDDDSSSAAANVVDYGPVYSDTLQALGVSFTYLDTNQSDVPSVPELHRYRAAVLFTGDNGQGTGLSGGERTRLQEWLDGGGRLLASGQNLAETQASARTDLSGRTLYRGYLGLGFVTGGVWRGAAPNPSAIGLGPFEGWRVDLSPDGDGARNQTSVEATRPITDTDTFAGTAWTLPVFRAISETLAADAHIGHIRASEPSLESPERGIRYRILSLGFGLEGVNGGEDVVGRNALLDRSLQWLLDETTVVLAPLATTVGQTNTLRLEVHSNTPQGATLTATRWDFGDGTPVLGAEGASVDHIWEAAGRYPVRVEATNALGHRALADAVAQVRPAGIYLPALARGAPRGP